MKRSAGRKAHQPVYGIFHISFISILSFFVFSSPGYGSTDIPVNVNTTPAVIEAAALFAGFGIGAGLPSQGIFTTGNGDIGPTAASAFVVAFHDEEAVYTETLLDIEPLNGTILTAHPPCQDSCSL